MIRLANGKRHTRMTRKEIFLQKKKKNLGSNRPVSQLDERHKARLVSFFDEDASTTIQDAVENLTAAFTGLQIKKTRVTEFMSEECNLSVKAVSCHPVGRNKGTLQARANWADHWIGNGMDYLKNCIFVDESGFDINMRRSRGWSQRLLLEESCTPLWCYFDYRCC